MLIWAYMDLIHKTAANSGLFNDWRFNILITTGLQPRAVACVSLATSQATNSYEVNADHGTWPADGFCRVLPEMEINAGDSYTMTVELMNVIGWSGVDSGHPGVMYNVIDENNFDLVYFRSANCSCSFHVLVVNFVHSTEYQRHVTKKKYLSRLEAC